MTLNMDFGSLQPVTEEKALQSILRSIEAITDEDLQTKGGWSEIDELSSRTIFDSIEGVPEGVFNRSDGRFEAAATVYVTLQYGSDDDGASMSDSFPATVVGHFGTDLNVDVDEIHIDTSSFFEDGDAE